MKLTVLLALANFDFAGAANTLVPATKMRAAMANVFFIFLLILLLNLMSFFI
jgi:hypothetical protein